MSHTLHLKIVTPERLVLERMVDQVSIPTTQGEITVLPKHIPLIAGLSSGDIVAVADGEVVPMAVAGGFVEAKQDEEKNTFVVILADFAEHVSELSEEVVEKAKARATELNKQRENEEIVDFEHFAVELERSLTRVRIAEKWRTKSRRHKQ